MMRAWVLTICLIGWVVLAAEVSNLSKEDAKPGQARPTQ